MKCQECSNWGSNLQCPPLTPKFFEAKELLRNFKYHYLVIHRDDMKKFIEKSAKVLGHKRAVSFASLYWDRFSYWKFQKIMVSMKSCVEEKAIFLGSGGSCRLCKTCAIHSIPKICRHRDRAMPSPESWGIDVYSTLLKNDVPIEIPARRIYTRVGIIASNVSLTEIFSKSFCKDTFASCIPKFKKERIENIIEKLSSFSVELLDVTSAIEYYVGINCNLCKYKKRWLCDRSLLPEEYLEKYIKDAKIAIFNIKKNYAKNLSKITDVFYCAGYYDALKFGNYPCNMCNKCGRFGCNLMAHRKPYHYGFKHLIRCIRYLGLAVENVDKEKTGYVVFIK